MTLVYIKKFTNRNNSHDYKHINYTNYINVKQFKIVNS